MVETTAAIPNCWPVCTIALAVRAGRSGTVYRWAVGAVGLIGVGAFSMSFLTLRNLMLTIGYSSATAWVSPAIIDTAVPVATVMLVALGDNRHAAPALRGTRLVVQSLCGLGLVGRGPL